MEKEVCLADVTTLSLNNKIYGHFYSVAKQYNLLFKNENFKVSIYIYNTLVSSIKNRLGL